LKQLEGAKDSATVEVDESEMSVSQAKGNDFNKKTNVKYSDVRFLGNSN
jgi:hypothetical protein